MRPIGPRAPGLCHHLCPIMNTPTQLTSFPLMATPASTLTTGTGWMLTPAQRTLQWCTVPPSGPPKPVLVDNTRDIDAVYIVVFFFKSVMTLVFHKLCVYIILDAFLRCFFSLHLWEKPYRLLGHGFTFTNNVVFLKWVLFFYLFFLPRVFNLAHCSWLLVVLIVTYLKQVDARHYCTEMGWDVAALNFLLQAVWTMNLVACNVFVIVAVTSDL